MKKLVFWVRGLLERSFWFFLIRSENIWSIYKEVYFVLDYMDLFLLY